MIRALLLGLAAVIAADGASAQGRAVYGFSIDFLWPMAAGPHCQKQKQPSAASICRRLSVRIQFCIR